MADTNVLEWHSIHSYPVSNLNRDDAGHPKEAVFGGVRRARISSQSQKRAVRTHELFADILGESIGIRTNRLISTLNRQLVSMGRDASQVEDVVPAIVKDFAGKLNANRPQETAVLLYLADAEIQALAESGADRWEEITDPGLRDVAIRGVVEGFVREHKDSTVAPDIALFGRFLAARPEFRIDGACQVMHALSTHRVAPDLDFFTAIDDLSPDDTAGAGMMGSTAFNSATYYRYWRVDLDQLCANLGGDIGLAEKTIEALLRTLVVAVPSGKKGAFAQYTPPAFLLAVVRRDAQSWNLVNAFEQPIAPSGRGFVIASVQALDAYWGSLCGTFGTDALVRTSALVMHPGVELDNLAEHVSPDLETWISDVIGALSSSAARSPGEGAS